ncbi:MAG: cyclase family protein [Thermoplasmata archaeon]|nr:cyclase family protein [Thermoplasmata archaeon]
MSLHAGLAVFPGDAPFRSEPSHSVARGDPYSVSTLQFNSHAGTHVDPPSHFLQGGLSADRLDLAALNGPCLVLGVDSARRVIGPSDLPEFAAGTQRVLFRTSNSQRWAREEGFFSDYVALSLPAAEELVRWKVSLVGIDSLSIESDLTGKFPVHRRLLEAGTIILEGLLLADVAPGPYNLECLPLKIRDGDGGPARAVLRTP